MLTCTGCRRKTLKPPGASKPPRPPGHVSAAAAGRAAVDAAAQGLSPAEAAAAKAAARAAKHAERHVRAESPLIYSCCIRKVLEVHAAAYDLTKACVTHLAPLSWCAPAGRRNSCRLTCSALLCSGHVMRLCLRLGFDMACVISSFSSAPCAGGCGSSSIVFTCISPGLNAPGAAGGGGGAGADAA